MGHKKTINRRSFLKAAAAGSATLALSGGYRKNAFSAEVSKNSPSNNMPTRVLGKTGAQVSILGMGGSIDTSGYQTLLRVGLNMGINYWDSANSYGNGRNEQVIGEFFSKYPEDRKKVFQVTKASRTTEPTRMSEQLDLSLERMQTDYIDLYFIHMLQDPDLLTNEIKAWADQKKKEGKIRFFGFSCHANMASMLTQAASLGWIDALMTSYSYQLMDNDDMNKAIDACHKAGIGLIAMKTQGQRIGPPGNMPGGRDGETIGPPQGMQTGDSVQDQDDLSATSHFMEKGYTLEQAKLKVVWEDKRISLCLSEMTSLAMLKDNVAAATDGIQLSSRDREVLDSYARNNRSLYCQGCMSCESVMGAETRIADILRLMMYYNSYDKIDDARRLFRELPDNVRNNIASRDYSSAEAVCPNKINIGRVMKEAALKLA